MPQDSSKFNDLTFKKFVTKWSRVASWIENLNLSSLQNSKEIRILDGDTRIKKDIRKLEYSGRNVGRWIHSSMVHPRRIWVTSREPSGHEKTRSSTPRHIKDVNARLSFFLSFSFSLLPRLALRSISPTNIPRLACSLPSPFPSINFKSRLDEWQYLRISDKNTDFHFKRMEKPRRNLVRIWLRRVWTTRRECNSPDRVLIYYSFNYT